MALNKRSALRRMLVLLSILALTIGCWVFLEYPTFRSGRAEKIISSLTTNAVTIMSILVASGAILMSIASTKLIKNLVKTGHYHKLVTSLILSIGLFLISALIGIVYLYAPIQNEKVYLSVVSGFFGAAIANFSDTGWKLYTVLNALHPRNVSTS